MALGTIPPWLSVSPASMLDAVRTGGAAGLEAAQMQNRADELAEERKLRAWQIAQELQQRAAEAEARREQAAAELEASTQYRLSNQDIARAQLEETKSYHNALVEDNKSDRVLRALQAMRPLIRSDGKGNLYVVDPYSGEATKTVSAPPPQRMQRISWTEPAKDAVEAVPEQKEVKRWWWFDRPYKPAIPGTPATPETRYSIDVPTTPGWETNLPPGIKLPALNATTNLLSGPVSPAAGTTNSPASLGLTAADGQKLTREEVKALLKQLGNDTNAVRRYLEEHNLTY